MKYPLLEIKVLIYRSELTKKNVMLKLFCAIIVYFLWLHSEIANAQNQTLEDQIINLQQRQIEEQLRQKEINRAIEESKKRDKLQEDEGETSTKDKLCFDIKEVLIERNTVISSRKLNKITRNYTNKCLGINKINNLTKELSNLYLKKGYTTSRVAVKQPQQLDDGVLELIVIEGKINDITLKENIRYTYPFKNTLDKIRLKEKSPSQKPTTKQSILPIKIAFPFYKGKVLNIKDTENSLEQVNRLSVSNAKMKILPANKKNTSDIRVINNKVIRLFPVDISYNNSGQDVTGKESTSFNLNLEDIASLNESLYVSVTKSVNSGRRNKRRFADSIYL